MGKLTFLPATAEHARYLAPRLRVADSIEVRDVSGMDPETALLDSIVRSEWAFTAVLYGRPVAAFGVVPGPLLSCVGIAWFLGTRRCALCPRRMVTVGRRAVATMLKSYSEVVNCIDARYEKAVRWAHLIGFEIGAPLVPPGRSVEVVPIIARRA